MSDTTLTIILVIEILVGVPVLIDYLLTNGIDWTLPVKGFKALETQQLSSGEEQE